MSYRPVIIDVADADWPVLLTSVDSGRDGSLASGPNGRLVTVSKAPFSSKNDTFTLISLPISASTRR